jgi:flagellar biosynthesis protein FliR
VITALLANLVLGLVSRLLPALQLLTVMLPLQLLLALVLLLFMVATATAGFGRFVEASLAFLDTGV